MHLGQDLQPSVAIGADVADDDVPDDDVEPVGAVQVFPRFVPSCGGHRREVWLGFQRGPDHCPIVRIVVDVQYPN